MGVMTLPRRDDPRKLQLYFTSMGRGLNKYIKLEYFVIFLSSSYSYSSFRFRSLFFPRTFLLLTSSPLRFTNGFLHQSYLHLLPRGRRASPNQRRKRWKRCQLPMCDRLSVSCSRYCSSPLGLYRPSHPPTTTYPRATHSSDP
jgi:hypothetical protein